MVAPVPSPSTASGPRVSEGLRLALAAVAAGALVLAVLVFITQRSEGSAEVETASGESDAGETGAGELSSSTDGPGEPLGLPSPPTQEGGGESNEEAAASEPAGGCPEGTIGEVCDAVAFIEAFKGDRPFKTFPTVNFLDAEAFDSFVLDDFDEAEEGLRDTGDVLASLGLIEPDVDLADALRTTLEVGVVGAYNTETNELNINGTEVDLYTQMVMVHELTHAWDDQYFELARPEYDDAEGEIGSGFLNVVEGSATLTQNAWRSALTPEQQDELSRLELSVITPGDAELLFAVPFFVLQLQISPYTDGAAFVQAIFDQQGLDGVDALFDEPPTTTEQVLHVEAYLAGEGAATVTDFTPPVAEFDRGVLGEVTFNLWLGADIGDGWGGDEYVSWRTADSVCTALSVVGDSAADTEEFRGALDAWANQAPGGSARSVDVVDGVVVATACI